MQNILNRIIKISIYSLVFLIPVFFLPFSFEAFEYNKQYLLFFLVSLAFFSWIAKMIVYDKEIRFKRSPLDIFVLAFLAAGILSAILSVDKTSSIYGFYGRFSNGLIGFLSLGALYFLITNNVGEKAGGLGITIKSLLKTFSWSVFIAIVFTYLAIFGIWAKLAGMLYIPDVMTLRMFNPASASLEGFCMLLAVFAVFLVGKMLTSVKTGKSAFINYGLLALSLVLLVIVDFTSAWMTLLITLLLFVVLSLWKRVFKENVNHLLVPIFLIIIAAVCIPMQPQKAIFGENSTIANLPQEQVLNQEVSWKIGLGAATDNVKSGFFGSGMGTFLYDFAKEKPASLNESWLWQIRFDRAGVYFSEVLATMGFVGILAYIALIGMFFMISYFFLQQRSQALLLLMLMTVLVVGQFFYYQNTALAFLFWLCLGLSVISWQKPIKEKVISFKNFPELSLVFSTVVILVGIGFLSMYFFGVKYYMADINYANAQNLTAGTARTQLLEKAVRLNPSLPQYRAILARAYMNQALIEMERPSDEQDSTRIQLLVATSINQARAATELAPNQVAMWETLGVVYREIRTMASGAMEWGVKSFETAIKLDPNNPVVYTELGKLYLTTNEIGKANDQFTKALEIKPDYTDALIQQALLLEREGDVKAAISELAGLATTYPMNTEISFQLGRLYFNDNQIENAVTMFSRVVILAPNHSNARYSLGVAYAAQGKTTEAIAEFEKVLELNPGNQDVVDKLNELR